MHGGLVPSYSDARVTKETVLGVLTCNMSAIGDGPCLKTLRGDRILVYWAGHGGDKMLLMPSGEPLCGPSFVQCRFTYTVLGMRLCQVRRRASRGAHATVEKRIFAARLLLGGL